MRFSFNLSSLLRRLILPGFAAAYLGYFGFHAFHGSYGIWAKARLENEAVALQSELDTLMAEKSGLQRRAAMLRPATLDSDMLDEQARRSLNIIRPNEVVILDAPPLATK
jgi:cell division protein FtsB